MEKKGINKNGVKEFVSEIKTYTDSRTEPTPQPQTYTITTSVTNGSYSGASTIDTDGTATVTITANFGYNLPSGIIVLGADYTWSSSTGRIVLSNPTSNIRIYAKAYQFANVYDREFDITKTDTLDTPTILATSESNVNINIIFNIKFSASFVNNFTFTLYDNTTQIMTNTISIGSSDVNIVKDIKLQGTQSSANNNGSHIYYITISRSDTSVSGDINLKRVNAQFEATNFTILNNISPYEVTFNYYTGKYYLSDCSNGYAKLAEVDENDLTSISSINWTQTNVEAQHYKVHWGGVNNGDGTYSIGERYDIILKKNNTCRLFKNSTPSLYYDYAEGVFMVSDRVTRLPNDTPAFISKWSAATQSMTYMRVYNDMTVRETTNIPNLPNWTNIAKMIAPRNNTAYLSNGSEVTAFFLCQTNGKWQYRYTTSASNSTIYYPKKFCSDMKIYTQSYVDPTLNYIIYAKRFGKFYKCTMSGQYNTATYGAETLLGEYDDLFPLNNGDYLVVKNGVWQYINGN